MGTLTKNFLTGLITILPIVLTFCLLYWLVVSSEMLLGEQLSKILPAGFYQPGLGVVIALVLCVVVGMLMNTYVVQQVFVRAENLLTRLPLVSLIYPMLRDFMDYFSPMKKKEFQQVVAISMGEPDVKLLGLVTQADHDRLPDGFNDQDNILVYLPMSYMIGGYALLVPRHRLQPVDMSLDAAMRFILTAGVTTTLAPHSTGPNPNSSPKSNLPD